jgi:dTDP-4-dehydrorhamnose reductase
VKLLVIGQNGQVARELVRRAPPGATVLAVGRDRADLREPAACAALVAGAEADAVINAAAFTAVDRAEAEEAEATVVNADAPGAMARAAARRGMPFLHISTDYVFDGGGSAAFTPDAPVAPLGAYGRSKLAGERQVAAAGGAHLILRTSWVFSAHGANFVKTMLRLGREREALNVVADQIGGPTPAAAIADALFAAARAMVAGAPGGVQHFAGMPHVSWADFARAIMAEAGLACRINDIPSTAYPTPARRPLNSRLDSGRFEAQFRVKAPDWRQGLKQVVAELGAGG